MPVKKDETHSANVLGLLRGSDPALAQQVVIYTAHHDHFGIGDPDETGDRIYNGARDNASGVGMVLGIAKAFKALPQPPRRSVLILLVAGEEQGLLGSQVLRRASDLRRPGASPPTSTSTAATSGARPATSPTSGWASPRSTPSCGKPCSIRAAC